MNRALTTILAVLLLAAAAPAATPGAAFLELVDADRADGRISTEQALLYKFQYGFDPQSLPEPYRPDRIVPLKCATPFVIEFERTRDQLSTATIELIDGYLQKNEAPDPDKAIYLSPGGRFRLTYETIGTDAVPTADLAPANGIPDFVERCAEYLDASWVREIDELGFTAPPLPSGYYEVDFESMGYYGYTSSTGAASTTITLHNDYEGFPANDDPDGNALGAAKVTCAHEFKHASQRAQSGWTEGGWVELDATWAEDIVFDATNDYYNYLPSDSPISAPASPLDDGGTGSYEDCVWQHFLTETWGEQIVPDLWIRRAENTGESMMTSYAAILGDYGSSLPRAWARFTAWNSLTGTSAIAGLGYDEAAGYPTAPPSATYTAYPIDRSSSVEHLAAHLLRFQDLPAEPGSVQVDFDGQDGADLTLAVAILRTNGTGLIEVIELDAEGAAALALPVPGEQIASFQLAVGNAATSGAAGYELTVDYVVDLPDPQLALDRQSISSVLVQGTTGSEALQVANDGEPASVLDYEIAVYPSVPAQPAAPDKSVSGSSFTASVSEYLPGETHAVTFTVTNGSPDLEWLTDIRLDFPAGFVVTASTDFVGGSGDLITDGATGDGAQVSWHGTDSSGWGVIQGGQTASATVTFAVDGTAAGPRALDWTIIGDQYGSTPHSLSGQIVLDAATPSLAVIGPNGGEIWATGSQRTLTWDASLLDEVRIELSRDGGSSWEMVAAATPNDGSEPWIVTGPASAECRLRVGSLDGQVSDTSDAGFEIFEPVGWLSVSPESGSVEQGAAQTITLGFDATGLTVATYGAVLVISHAGAASPAVVPVELRVAPASSAADLPGPAFGLTGNHPNPFNPATEITLRLPAAGRAVVEVLDVRGRRLRTLHDGTLTAGEHRLRWDGCDEKGRELASGLYLARLRAGGLAATHKMILAR